MYAHSFSVAGWSFDTVTFHLVILITFDLIFDQEFESTIIAVKPQLKEVDDLAKDVLDYLSSCEVTSLSIRGDLNALAERHS